MAVVLLREDGEVQGRGAVEGNDDGSEVDGEVDTRGEDREGLSPILDVSGPRARGLGQTEQ